MNHFTQKFKYYLYLNLFLDSLNWSILIPILPIFYKNLNFSTFYIGIFASFLSILTFFSGLSQGFLTNYFSKNLLIFLSSLSQLFGFIFLLLSLYYKNVFYLVLSRGFPSLFKATMIISQALLVEINKMNQNSNFSSNSTTTTNDLGYLYANSNFAYIIGPFLGGFLYSYSPYYPLYIGVLTSLLSLILINSINKMIEELKRISSSVPNYSLSNSLKTTTTSSSSISKTSSILNNTSLLSFLHIKFSFQLSNSFYESFNGPFLYQKLNLSSNHIGLIFGFGGFIAMITNSYLLQKLLSYFNKNSNTKLNSNILMEKSLFYLLLLMYIGLFLWVYFSNFTLILFSIVIITISSNLFLGIVQGIIATKQDSNKEEEIDIEKVNYNDIETEDNVIKEFNEEKYEDNNMKKSLSSSQSSLINSSSYSILFSFSATIDRFSRIISPFLGGIFYSIMNETGLVILVTLMSFYCFILLIISTEEVPLLFSSIIGNKNIHKIKSFFLLNFKLKNYQTILSLFSSKKSKQY